MIEIVSLAENDIDLKFKVQRGFNYQRYIILRPTTRIFLQLFCFCDRHKMNLKYVNFEPLSMSAK